MYTDQPCDVLEIMMLICTQFSLLFIYYRPAELIGAMSFSLRHCLTEPFTGWYYLLDECLATTKHMKADTPKDPYLLQPKMVEDNSALYQNTTEQYYKQPRKVPLKTSQSQNVLQSHKRVKRRHSSVRRPPPKHQPPPIPGSLSSSNSDLTYSNIIGGRCTIPPQCYMYM